MALVAPVGGVVNVNSPEGARTGVGVAGVSVPTGTGSLDVDAELRRPCLAGGLVAGVAARVAAGVAAVEVPTPVSSIEGTFGVSVRGCSSNGMLTGVVRA